VSSFTKLHLELDELRGLTNPWRALGARAVALGVLRLAPGEGYTFTHHHAEQEEVYAVLDGAGAIWIDGTEHALERGDLVRVAPEARRALRAAADRALLALCIGAVPAGYPKQEGARYLIDDGVPHYDDLPPWCADDPEARRRNAELAERAQRSRLRRDERD
jgi:quercetin dioxygenase-like cupin family protein